MTTWLPVVEYEDLYLISDDGQVFGVKRGKPLALVPDERGRHRVTLSLGSSRKNRFVHHLVLEAFVGPRPEGMEACHGNDVQGDDRLENLRWDTPQANKQDAVANGKNRQSLKTRCPAGHRYDEANTYVHLVNGRPHRLCRACGRERKRLAA